MEPFTEAYFLTPFYSFFFLLISIIFFFVIVEYVTAYHTQYVERIFFIGPIFFFLFVFLL